jgi:hypothetical protein
MIAFLKLLNSKLAKIFKRPKQVAVIALLVTLLINTFAPDAIIDNFKISFNSLFTGMLALIGFIFASRSFITFKLYETVYSTERYQKKIYSLKNDGAYKNKLMHPLTVLDQSLSFTTSLSIFAMLALTLMSFVKPPDIDDIKSIQEVLLVLANHYNEISISTIKSNFYPVFYKIFSDLVCSIFVIVFLQLIYNLRSLNRNIGSIIDVWQEQADENERKFDE